MIPIFWPYQGANKKILEELKKTLNTRWWGQGPKVEEFENKFGEKFNYKYPLFVNSGTSALELAYHLIGLKKGDEVIVPVLNCTAGQTGLLRRGVEIVFSDVSRLDFNLTKSHLEKKITKKTKAIVAVNLGGIPVENAVYKLARKHNIPVITDSAQYHAKTQGDYICYSFQAIKSITTGDGGMLILKNKREYERAKKLRWFGIDREAKKRSDWQPWKKRQMTMDIEEAGYKYQPTDIDATFGLVMLSHLDKILAHNRKLCELYDNLLFDVQHRSLTSFWGGTCWLFGLHLNSEEDRDALAQYLKKNNVETNIVHLRNDIFKVMGGKRKRDLKIMNSLEFRYLYLPLNTKVTEKEVKYICNKINEFFRSRAR